MTAPVIDPRLQALEELRWHVGNSPLHKMLRLSPKPGVEIHAKLEWQQFGGSVKARPAFNIIHDAVVSGALQRKDDFLMHLQEIPELHMRYFVLLQAFR